MRNEYTGANGMRKKRTRPKTQEGSPVTGGTSTVQGMVMTFASRYSSVALFLALPILMVSVHLGSDLGMILSAVVASIFTLDAVSELRHEWKETDRQELRKFLAVTMAIIFAGAMAGLACLWYMNGKGIAS